MWLLRRKLYRVSAGFLTHPGLTLKCAALEEGKRTVGRCFSATVHHTCWSCHMLQWAVLLWGPCGEQQQLDFRWDGCKLKSRQVQSFSVLWQSSAVDTLGVSLSLCNSKHKLSLHAWTKWDIFHMREWTHLIATHSCKAAIKSVKQPIIGHIVNFFNAHHLSLSINCVNHTRQVRRECCGLLMGHSPPSCIHSLLF